MPKVEYLAILFEGPPPAVQLTNEFGKDGWMLTSLLPVTVQNDEDGGEPVHRLQGYFVRVESKSIVLPR